MNESPDPLDERLVQVTLDLLPGVSPGGLILVGQGCLQEAERVLEGPEFSFVPSLNHPV